MNIIRSLARNTTQKRSSLTKTHFYSHLILSQNKILLTSKHPLQNTQLISNIIHKRSYTGSNLSINDQFEDTGFLNTSFMHGVGTVRVEGLRKVNLFEIVEFTPENSDEILAKGIVLQLLKDEVIVGLHQANNNLDVGVRVKRSNTFVQTPVGEALKGRVVNALGEIIDDLDIPFDPKDTSAIMDLTAPHLTERDMRAQSIESGYSVIDLLTPISKGSTVLLCGTPGGGKTTFALDLIVHQHRLAKSQDLNEKSKMHCIYVCVGKSAPILKSIVDYLRQSGAMENTTIVSSDFNDLPLLQVLSAYSGIQMGEYWRKNGGHALVIIDDINTHANTHLAMYKQQIRSISTLNYAYGRLFEKSGSLIKNGGSLTIFPVFEGTIESYEGSSYQQFAMFLESLADSRLEFEKEALSRGVTPAVKLQSNLIQTQSLNSIAVQTLVKQVKKTLQDMEKVQEYRNMVHEIDPSEALEHMDDQLQRGRKVLELLRQRRHSPLTYQEQLLLLFVSVGEVLQSISLRNVTVFKERLLEYYKAEERNIHPYHHYFGDLVAEFEEWKKYAATSNQVTNQLKHS